MFFRATIAGPPSAHRGRIYAYTRIRIARASTRAFVAFSGPRPVADRHRCKISGGVRRTTRPRLKCRIGARLRHHTRRLWSNRSRRTHKPSTPPQRQERPTDIAAPPPGAMKYTPERGSRFPRWSTGNRIPDRIAGIGGSERSLSRPCRTRPRPPAQATMGGDPREILRARAYEYRSRHRLTTRT